MNLTILNSWGVSATSVPSRTTCILVKSMTTPSKVKVSATEGAIKRVSHQRPTLRSGYEARFPTRLAAKAAHTLFADVFALSKCYGKGPRRVVSKLSRVCKTSVTNRIYGDKEGHPSARRI